MEYSVVLDEIGVPKHQLGYEYILEVLYLLDKGVFNSWIEIYSHIAKSRDISLIRVERDIRYTLQSVRDNCRHDVVEKYLGYTFTSNSASLLRLWNTIHTNN